MLNNVPKLAIVTTHPIQYNAPMFRLLAERGRVQIKVFYTWGSKVLEEKYDPGFGKAVEWDIPLLQGYDHTFVQNVAEDPGSHHFKGIVNPALVSEIERWGANAVLVFGWSFNSHLKVMRHFKNKIPVLFRGDSTLLDEPGTLKKILRKFYLRFVYSFVDKALFAGKMGKDYFLSFGLEEPQLVFMPHAIDNKRFSSGSDEGKSLRSKMNLPENEIVFLFAGKLEPKKNPALLLEAFVQGSFKNASLVIVGNGILENELKARFAKENNIHFLPFQNQSKMPAVYHACDVLALPSQGPGESWGLAVNEAMAAGKAVLVSDKCGCYPDLVKDHENGFVFRSNDKGDLKNKLGLLAASKNKVIAFGKKSADEIESWSFESQCSAVETAVKQSVK